MVPCFFPLPPTMLHDFHATVIALSGMTYNIGSSFEISVRDVVQSVLSVKLDCRVSDEELEEHVEYVPDRACNDSSYHIDNSRLVALGWCPTVSWEVGLARTRARLFPFSCLLFVPPCALSSTTALRAGVLHVARSPCVGCTSEGL